MLRTVSVPAALTALKMMSLDGVFWSIGWRVDMTRTNAVGKPDQSKKDDTNSTLSSTSCLTFITR